MIQQQQSRPLPPGRPANNNLNHLQTTTRRHPTAPAALRRLNTRDRDRILTRLAELDHVRALVTERPYGRRWAA